MNLDTIHRLHKSFNFLFNSQISRRTSASVYRKSRDRRKFDLHKNVRKFQEGLQDHQPCAVKFSKFLIPELNSFSCTFVPNHYQFPFEASQVGKLQARVPAGAVHKRRYTAPLQCASVTNTTVFQPDEVSSFNQHQQRT
jgi:hypothetical protein